MDTIWIQKFENFWPMNLYEIDTTWIQKFKNVWPLFKVYEIDTFGYNLDTKVWKF